MPLPKVMFRRACKKALKGDKQALKHVFDLIFALPTKTEANEEAVNPWAGPLYDSMMRLLGPEVANSVRASGDPNRVRTPEEDDWDLKVEAKRQELLRAENRRRRRNGLAPVC